jgi:hypothetical protein
MNPRLTFPVSMLTSLSTEGLVQAGMEAWSHSSPLQSMQLSKPMRMPCCKAALIRERPGRADTMGRAISELTYAIPTGTKSMSFIDPTHCQASESATASSQVASLILLVEMSEIYDFANKLFTENRSRRQV